MARSVKPKALINAGGQRTIQTPANGKVKIVAVEQELCRCPSNMASGLELPQVRVLKVLCQSTVFHIVHIFSHNSANGYINTLQNMLFLHNHQWTNECYTHEGTYMTCTTITLGMDNHYAIHKHEDHALFNVNVWVDIIR